MVESEYILDVMYNGEKPYTRRFSITREAFDSMMDYCSKYGAKSIFCCWRLSTPFNGVLMLDLSLAGGIKLFHRPKQIRNADDKPLNPDMNNPLARDESLYDDPMN